MAAITYLMMLMLGLLLPRDSVTYQAGAPAGQCDAMMPSHDGNTAQAGASSYTITASPSTYKCGDTITVTVAATSGNFKGFLCEARTDPNTYSTVVGTMAAVAGSPVPSSEPCGTGKGLTHTNSGDKTSFQFTWTTNQNHGNVQFVCTIVKVKADFWVKEASSAITYVAGGQCSDGSHVIASFSLLSFLLILSHIAL